MMSLTDAQLESLVVAERASSILSLIGTLTIIALFLTSTHFQKPINRLIFYASIGNVLVNVGTLVSRAGIEAGLDSPLCQLQAFLIQMYATSLRQIEQRTDKDIGSCRLTPSGHWLWLVMFI